MPPAALTAPQSFSQLKTKKKRKEKLVIIGKKKSENFKRNLNHVGPTRKLARKANHGEKNKVKKRNWNVRKKKKMKTPKNWIKCLAFDRKIWTVSKLAKCYV